jgi:hypothetical protein
MSSEIKVDTISENTSANGVTIDSLGIKDGKITNLMNATLSAADLGSGLHIKTADSGATVSSTSDELVIEGSSVGMSFLDSTSGATRIAFGDSGDDDIGKIIYAHSDNSLSFTVNTGERLRLTSDGKVSTGGEASPNGSAGTLVLQQGANDDEIFILKSSDVAHGMTTQGETDDFMHIQKFSDGTGGIEVKTMTEGTQACYLACFSTTVNTGSAHSADANFMVQASKKDGTGTTNLDSNDNLAVFRNHSNAQVIIKGDGELFNNQTATIQVFDEYEDAQLIRSIDLAKKETAKGFIDSQYDKFIKYNHETLAEANLVGRNEDGTPNHYVNITGMQRLHNGAIWQQYEKHQKLANAMYELAKAAVGEEKANEILKQNDIKLLN